MGTVASACFVCGRIEATGTALRCRCGQTYFRLSWCNQRNHRTGARATHRPLRSQTKVLRLSEGVYGSRSLAAVGIAAHEAGHALQDAQGYSLMAIRNAAVGVANFGSGFGLIVFMVGLGMALAPLAWLGIALFGATVFFQLVNLPVEFDASNRAKAQLVALGIVPAADMPHVNRVLNAAAWTYVAGTLQSILTLLYYASYLTGGSSDSDR